VLGQLLDTEGLERKWYEDSFLWTLITLELKITDFRPPADSNETRHFEIRCR